jgi:hypothetical protein
LPSSYFWWGGSVGPQITLINADYEEGVPWFWIATAIVSLLEMTAQRVEPFCWSTDYAD